MGKVKKLEQRTIDFTEALKRLESEGKITDRHEVAKLLKFKGISSISEIMSGRQNISPERWGIFKSAFGLKKTEISEQRNSEMGENEILPGNHGVTIGEYISLLRESKAKLEKDKELLARLLESNLMQLKDGQVILQTLMKTLQQTTEDVLVNQGKKLEKIQGDTRKRHADNFRSLQAEGMTPG